jgi:small conductance mechanosensitive channel
MRQRFLSKVKNQFSLQKRLSFYSFWRWLLFWLQIIVWYVTAIWVCAILPQLMPYRGWVLAFPLDILFIWFFTSLAIRLSNRAIDRIFNAWKTQKFLPLKDSERKEMRTGTISQAVKGLVTFLFLFAAIAFILNLFGISTSSIIAGGAVIGFAVSLGSQNVIKDLVNGFLILIEDQYAVGDVVKVGTASGLVENLNLRITQIRNAEGSLVTIPNSSIVEVENLTRNWSRVNFTIEVAYSADIDLALKLLNQVGEEMFHDEQWKSKLLELPQVLGVDEVTHHGLLIRVWIRTAPLQQWSVGREFRYRVKMIFAENDIEIGKPQLVNYYSDFPFLNSEPSDEKEK